MPTAIEIEIGLTFEQYRTLNREQLDAKSKELTPEQIRAFSSAFRETVAENIWQQRLNGTYPLDVEIRKDLIKEITGTPDVSKSEIHQSEMKGIKQSDWCRQCEHFGMLFEDYITSYPVNKSSYSNTTTILGAYGGVLNFQLLEKAIDEILEVAFDKFGFMLEYIQDFEYLSPTFGMIGATMRRKMPEYDKIPHY